MKTTLTGLTALAVVFSGVMVAQATTLTFEELPNPAAGGSLIAGGYGGLQWDNFYYLNGLNNNYNPSGYENAVVSPNNVAYNGYSNPAATSSGPFTFHSAYFTAAWNDNLHILAEGHQGASVVYSREFIVDTTGPSLEVFNWSGIEKVQFTSWGGTRRYAFGGAHFAMDNFTYTVPEPSAFLLGALGLLGITIYRRKRT